MDKYDHLAVEKKWQNFWLKNKTFKAKQSSNKPKYYALDMFPYPSGAGLHVGHPLGYTATDIICRKKRMEGYEVLHPMGWDAFGLPAENYAIKTGVHPSKSTNENIDNFRRQIQSLGFSYDWDREVNTTDPDYYKWSQWIFLQLYKKGLLYEKEMPMSWCPKCKIVAANEEVENGKHERCGSEVEKKNLKQWLFKITDYAERLLNDMNTPNVYIIHGYGADSNGNWFQHIGNVFKNGRAHVHIPDMPNTDAPKYEEWRDHFKKKYPKIWSQDIVIGHSLGGGFWQRFLAEENVKVDHLVLVAPAVHDHGIPQIANFFENPIDYEAIKKKVNKISIWYSDNDQFIDHEDFKKLAEKLDAEEIFLPGEGHLMEPDFPALTEWAEQACRSILDWPDKIKAMQRNWIGKSHGVDVDWKVDGHKDITLSTYTTTVDTIEGVTFAVISPEHPKLMEMVTNEHKASVEKYLKKSAEKSELERTSLDEKTGVETGAYIINPVNGSKVPLYVADYVLMSYGTGVVMGVPAHDQRDHDFAQKYGIKITQVIANEDGETFFYDDVDKYAVGGKVVFKGDYEGIDIQAAREKITDDLVKANTGERKTNYKLRDWIFTRQRYWGEPIPLVFDQEGTCYPLDESELPLELPDTPNYEPSDTGESPLAKVTDWVDMEGYITADGTVKTKDLAGKNTQKFHRETSTMPNWAGSSWYWLRYMDPDNKDIFCDKEHERYWGPVDLYVGGAEHAVLHLLYGRFWHKALYDLGLVTTKEPFKKLVNQGLILAEDGQKMSKSLGNVVNPDDIVASHGADTLRCYEMFMGPFEQAKAWNTGAVGGIRKFLDRAWRVLDKAGEDEKLAENLLPTLHKTIKIVGEHIDEFRFNTAISQLMVLTNELTAAEKISPKILETYALLLAPFAPHLAEECWQSLGHQNSLCCEPWPTYEEKYLVEDMVTYAVQVNGKVRGDFQIEKSADKDTVIAEAKKLEKVASYLKEGDIKKEIFVPEKIVGFVVKN